MKKSLYLLMWWAIAIISCIDLYWAIRLGNKLIEVESNPLGIYLMKLGGLELFMSLKMLGTILVLAILSCLYKQRPKIAWWVIVPLFILQSMLCYHLLKLDAQSMSDKRIQEYRKLEGLR